MRKESRFLAVLSAAAMMALACPALGAGNADSAYAQEKSRLGGGIRRGMEIL